MLPQVHNARQGERYLVEMREQAEPAVRGCAEAAEQVGGVQPLQLIRGVQNCKAINRRHHSCAAGGEDREGQREHLGAHGPDKSDGIRNAK